MTSSLSAKARKMVPSAMPAASAIWRDVTRSPCSRISGRAASTIDARRSSGEALHPLVREQRAARALYMLARPEGPPDMTPARLDMLATQSGLRSAAAFASACVNLFGIEPAQLMQGGQDARRPHAPAWAGWPLTATAWLRTPG